jgi:hypothetical protein
MCISRVRFPDTQQDITDKWDETNRSTDAIVRQHLLDEPIRNFRLFRWSDDKCVVENSIYDITSTWNDTL